MRGSSVYLLRVAALKLWLPQLTQAGVIGPFGSDSCFCKIWGVRQNLYNAFNNLENHLFYFGERKQFH